MTTAISNSTGNAVSAAAPKTFRDLILMDAYKASLAAALPKHLTADRMVRVVLTALNRNLSCWSVPRRACGNPSWTAPASGLSLTRLVAPIWFRTKTSARASWRVS